MEGVNPAVSFEVLGVHSKRDNSLCFMIVAQGKGSSPELKGKRRGTGLWRGLNSPGRQCYPSFRGSYKWNAHPTVGERNFSPASSSSFLPQPIQKDHKSPLEERREMKG